MNRSDRRRQTATLAKTGDAAAHFAADMRAAADLHKQGQTKAAGDRYRKIAKAYEAHPEVRVAWTNLGASLMAQGRFKDAVAALKKARAMKPEAPAPHHNLGMAYLELGRIDEALESLSRAVELDPAFHDAWISLGNACEAAGQFDRAEGACRSALENDPQSLMARFNLGNILRRTGRAEEAVDAYRLAVELAPTVPEVRYALGRALEEAGRPAEAAEAYLETIALSPAAETVHNQMGIVLRVLSATDPDRARDVAHRWREAAPQSATALHLSAAILGEAPGERAPDAYLRAQFDTFANVYDAALTAIGNRGPALLEAAVAEHVGTPEARLSVLDAGCGTGLLGTWLRPHASELEGIDVSPGMILKARERNIYDRLASGELSAHLSISPDRYDLIACGDVLPYFGDLSGLLRVAGTALRAGGHFVATAERLAEGDDFALRPSGRYAHAEPHLRNALSEAGLEVTALTVDTLRREGGADVPGFVLVARKPA